MFVTTFGEINKLLTIPADLNRES